jgi:GTP1/Obg family GTP-binding protein
MLAEPTEPFHVVEKRISERYGRLFHLSEEDRRCALMDIIESWEDIQRLTPVFKQIADATLPEADFRDAISSIETWAWHLSDHLASLNSLLEKEFDTYIEHLDESEHQTRSDDRRGPS